MKTSLRIGVVGAGRMGRLHARTLSSLPEVAEVVLLGRKESEAPTFSREACVDLDGLVIATPTDTHFEIIEVAAGLGVPLLVEKPLAMSVDEQLRIIETVERAGVACMVGFQRRFDPGYRELRERLRSGSLGRLRGVTSINGDHHHAHEAFIPTSGGMWIDQAIHDFDILPWLLDDYVTDVWAYSAVLEEPMYRRHGDVDTGTAMLRFSSGLVATVFCGRKVGGGQENRTEVYGTQASMGAGLHSLSAVLSTDPSEASLASAPYGDAQARFYEAYVGQDQAFLDLILGQGDSMSPIHDSVYSLRLAIAVETACQTGQRTPVT